MAFPASGLFVATMVDALDTTQLALDLDLETHKVALFTNSLGAADLTTDTGYGAGVWASNEVPNGSGYATGGIVLTTTVFVHVATGLCKWDADDSSWTSATFSAVRGCLAYADVLAGNNGIVAVNFGGDFQVSGGTFQIQWNVSGIWTVDWIP